MEPPQTQIPSSRSPINLRRPAPNRNNCDFAGFVHLCEVIGCKKVAIFCQNHAAEAAQSQLQNMQLRVFHNQVQSLAHHSQLSQAPAKAANNSANSQRNPMQSLIDQSFKRLNVEQQQELSEKDIADTCERSKKTKTRCLESGCGKRRFAKSELCVDHSRPSTCIMSKCAETVTEGAGLCQEHLVQNATGDAAVALPSILEPLTTGKRGSCSVDSEDTCKSRRCKKPRATDKEVCVEHIDRPFCKIDYCSSLAHGKGLCKGKVYSFMVKPKLKCSSLAHGGTPLCKISGCKTGARGKSKLCVAHGGGRRCSVDNCSNGAINRQGRCRRHGGGKRCKFYYGFVVYLSEERCCCRLL